MRSMRLRIEGWIKKPTRQEIKQDNSCHYDVVEGVGQVLHTQVLVLISCSPTEASEWGSSDGGRYDRFDGNCTERTSEGSGLTSTFFTK